MFVHLTKRTKFLVRVRLFSKRTNTNELPPNGSQTVRRTFGSFAALLTGSHGNQKNKGFRLNCVLYSNLQVDYAYMLDVDSLGFNVKAGYKDKNFKLRVAFPRRAEERKDVKTLIIEMLQAAKSRVD
ncbi:putative heme oxygenase HugZ-like superfamily [Helianthus annuus]|nr:putative heme oxygenase HugZ-like superfamily [Helianthus annuus]